MRNAKTPSAVAWLLLITNLPGRNQTLRMRLWRALKSAGAALLKDGVYVLPSSPDARRLFAEQAQEITSAGGSGHILVATAESAEQAAVFHALFDRTAEYREALERLGLLKRQFAKLSESEARQKLAVARRDITALMDRDFFPGKPHEQMSAALTDAETALNRLFSPDEPLAARKELEPKDPQDYRRRTWATRRRLWIDRVACAWLIRRCVDPEAKSLWLEHARDCPKKAVGFDFDGAEFTHVGARVTFEVILASFGFERDVGLTRLGSLVYYLDVGGVPVAEAAGFASIMAGARTLHADDDASLNAVSPVLESLYASYSQAKD